MLRVQSRLGADDQSARLTSRSKRSALQLWLRRSVADGSLFFALAVIAVWMLSRPFQGIEGDARIYIGRALADLHPQTIGRDMMFVYDGQSQFSIFSFITDRLVALFNPARAALILAIVNLVWLAAAFAFIGAFAKGRIRLAILMVVAIVPCAYGAYSFLHFGEQYAVPRPLAEACVLAGLGALLGGRHLLSAACLALGALFHPIMALPGIAIFALYLCAGDRRWITAACLLGALGLIASVLGVPVLDRLWHVIDPEWLALLRSRNPYLFPSLWPLEAYGALGLQLTTILVAACYAVNGRVRRVFLAVAGLGCGGVLLSLLFGDLLPLLLVVQAQLWRATWLVSAFGAISLGLCLFTLPQRASRYALAAALLALGWFFADAPIMALACSALAVICCIALNDQFKLSRLMVKSIWAFVILAGLLSKLGTLSAFIAYARTLPPGAHVSFTLLWNIFFLSIPLALFAFSFVARAKFLTTPVVAACAVIMLFGVAVLWNDRSDAHRFADAAPFPADLAALVPDDDSEVLWIGGPDPWYLLDHPSWGLFIQGAGIVFSRPLAMLWQERLQTLVSLDLADENVFAPWSIPPRASPLQVTRHAVEQLCVRADAPSAIVAPIEAGMAYPKDVAYRTWHPPVDMFRLSQEGEAVSWHRTVDYIVISCATHAPQR